MVSTRAKMLFRLKTHSVARHTRNEHKHWPRWKKGGHSQAHAFTISPSYPFGHHLTAMFASVSNPEKWNKYMLQEQHVQNVSVCLYLNIDPCAIHDFIGTMGTRNTQISATQSNNHLCSSLQQSNSLHFFGSCWLLDWNGSFCVCVWIFGINFQFSHTPIERRERERERWKRNTLIKTNALIF